MKNELARPTDGYGRSKLAAEAAVGKSGVPFTILRPVVIYGPGVKANLESLIAFADSPWPLPFGRLSQPAVTACNGKSCFRDRILAAIGATQRNLRRGGSGARHFRGDDCGFAHRAWTSGAPLQCSTIASDRGAVCCRKIVAGRADRGTLVADAHKLRMAGWKPGIDTKRGLAALVQAASP
jgi:UDP-glucose 4-epimerase